MPSRAICVRCRVNETQAGFAPFCSERCRLLDLAAWIDGDYRVPGDPVEPEPESPESFDEG